MEGVQCRVQGVGWRLSGALRTPRTTNAQLAMWDNSNGIIAYYLQWRGRGQWLALVPELVCALHKTNTRDAGRSTVKQQLQLLHRHTEDPGCVQLIACMVVSSLWCRGDGMPAGNFVS